MSTSVAALETYDVPDLQEVWVNITNAECLTSVRAGLARAYDWAASSIGILTDEDDVVTEWMTLHGVTAK